MSDFVSVTTATSSNAKDIDSLLDENDLPTSINDLEFNIPKLTSLPTLESILHEQDPQIDNLSLSSSIGTFPIFSPYDDRSIDKSSQPSLASFDLSSDTSVQPVEKYLMKIHHQKQDSNNDDQLSVTIPQHNQIHHGSLLKLNTLDAISNQLKFCVERTSYGQPTTIDILVNRLVAIGTTKGVVLLFEYRNQTLKHYLISDAMNGSVSALNLNGDASRLLVGYARGRIHMYDCSNGKILRTIGSDCHAPDTGILTIKFTHDPTVALFGDSGGSVYVLHFTRHLKRDFQSKCLFSGSRGEVCAIEPLVFTNSSQSLSQETNEKLDQHPLKGLYLVALATFTKVFILALKGQGNVKILHVHGLMGSNSTLPILKWQFVIVKVSDQTNCISPVLAAVRDRRCSFFQIQHVRDDEVQISRIKKIQVDYQIKSFAWLNARTFVLFDLCERAHVIDQCSEEQLECLSLSHCELIYNTTFFKSLETGGNVSSAFAAAGQNACYQTFVSNQSQIYLLSIDKLHEIHLRDWSERIEFYIENGKNQFEEALEITYSMLVGKAKGLTGLPMETDRRRQILSDRMVSLLQGYLKYSLNDECPQSGNIELLNQHYRNILPRSIDYCLLLDRLDLCFGLIYDLFCKDSIAHGIYLQCLEPYIMKNRFESISPVVLKDFVNYYVENKYFNQLEQCLNRLDVSCLDIEQVVNLTREHNLYMTLLHIYSEAFKDFRTILQEIIEKLEDDFVKNGCNGYSEKMTQIGNYALVFIQNTFSGDVFPFGGRLSNDMAFYGRNELVDYLSYLHPRKSGGLLYNNLRILLHFNTQDFFNLLTMAFDNEEFLRDVDVLKRRLFCDILLRVMVDDVQFSSHEISILFRFLSRQLAKAGQQHVFVQGMLFEQVLEYLCKSVLTSTETSDEGKDEREKALLDVVQAAGLQSFDVGRLLSLARQARFWKVCEVIYLEKNQYDLVFECYINDKSRQLESFRYVRTLWPSIDENEQEKVRTKIFQHFEKLLETDALQSFKLFCIFFKMDLRQVLKMIEHNENLQFQILKSCFSYNEKKRTEGATTISVDNSLYSDFIEMLARHEPSQLLNFLKTESDHYRAQDVLETLRLLPSGQLVPALSFLLETLGQFNETFDLLLQSMHQWKTIEELYQKALDCVKFCQRTTVKLKNRQERDQLWVRFLDEILLISSSKSFENEELTDFRRIYGEILNSMIGYVTLPSILERIMRSDSVGITTSTRRNKAEIRQLVQSMLENCSFELRLFETTRRLLERDLHDDVDEICRLMKKSVPIRKSQCVHCSKFFNETNIEKSSTGKFFIFACRHVFHSDCLNEIVDDPSKINFCPVCHVEKNFSFRQNPTSAQKTSANENSNRLSTLIHFEHQEKQTALTIRQKQVLDAILEQKQNRFRKLNPQTNSPTISTVLERNVDLPDAWRQHIAPVD